jgi:hypothetical protein
MQPSLQKGPDTGGVNAARRKVPRVRMAMEKAMVEIKRWLFIFRELFVTVSPHTPASAMNTT